MLMISPMRKNNQSSKPIKARRMDIKGGDDNIGVIYIDSSVKNYTYSPDQLRLLTAIRSPKTGR